MISLSIKIQAILVGELLFSAIVDDEDNTTPMINALTGEICDVSVIYKGVLVLRDDRLGDDIDDIGVEIMPLMSAKDGRK